MIMVALTLTCLNRIFTVGVRPSFNSRSYKRFTSQNAVVLASRTEHA